MSEKYCWWCLISQTNRALVGVWYFMGVFQKAISSLGYVQPTDGGSSRSKHGPICYLFELILVIHANTSNWTNHIVQLVFVGIPRSHECYHMLTYHAQANMSHHKLHTMDMLGYL
jgi:hypothetical protein